MQIFKGGESHLEKELLTEIKNQRLAWMQIFEAMITIATAMYGEKRFLHNEQTILLKKKFKSLTRRGNKIELTGGKREMAVKDGKKFWKVCHRIDANKVNQMRDDLIFYEER